MTKAPIVYPFFSGQKSKKIPPWLRKETESSSINSARKKPARRVPITAPPSTAPLYTTTPFTTTATATTTTVTTTTTTTTSDTAEAAPIFFEDSAESDKELVKPVNTINSKKSSCRPAKYRGLRWPSTEAGEVARLKCPGLSITGD